MRQIYITVIWLLFSFASSCKKEFLINPPTTSVESREFIEKLRLEGCNQLLNGAYQELGQNFFHGLNLIYMDLTADNIKPSNNIFNNHYIWNQIGTDNTSRIPSSSTQDMSPLWLAGYHIVRVVNFVLENVEKFRDDNWDLADSIKGQALAIRALVHWQMLHVFAQPYNYTADGSHLGIPYVTTYDYSIITNRQQVYEVYNYIIEDLQSAIMLLPNHPKNVCYLGGIAAQALLSRVYLYKGDYIKSKELAISVANIIPIMTGSNYPSKLFTNLETEALFQLPPSSTGVSNGTYSTTFEGIYFAPGTSQSFFATSDIVNMIKEYPADSRSTWFSPQGNNWRIVKFPTNVISGFSNSAGSYYQTILRSSEMYLTAAECLSKLGDDVGAIKYLDQIRKRARSNASNTTASGSALIDSVLKERRKELCFEGLRMPDLLRLQIGVNRIDATFSNALMLPYPNKKAIAPIPVRDVSIYGYPQNDGYE